MRVNITLSDGVDSKSATFITWGAGEFSPIINHIQQQIRLINNTNTSDDSIVSDFSSGSELSNHSELSNDKIDLDLVNDFRQPIFNRPQNIEFPIYYIPEGPTPEGPEAYDALNNQDNFFGLQPVYVLPDDYEESGEENAELSDKKNEEEEFFSNGTSSDNDMFSDNIVNVQYTLSIECVCCNNDFLGSNHQHNLANITDFKNLEIEVKQLKIPDCITLKFVNSDTMANDSSIDEKEESSSTNSL